MSWEILWALILGFGLSAAVQAVVSKVGDDAPAAGRFPRSIAIACGARRRLVELFVRGRRTGSVDLPQGRELHGGDGVRVRVDEPRDRARHHPGVADGLAVHARRVRGGTHHDRPPDDRVPAHVEAGHGAGGAGERGPRDRRFDGGSRRDGHVRDRGIDPEATDLGARLHGAQPLVRDGLGRGLVRHRRRVADRRRPCRMGARTRSGSRSSWSTTRCSRRCGAR